MGTLVEANTEFAVDLCKILIKENPNKNVFYSPLSISAASGMVLLGAKGDTAKQMEKTLHFDKITGSGSSASSPAAGAQCDKPGGPHPQFKELLAAINQHTKNYALSIANRLYGEQRYEFHQKYLHCTKEMYGADLERVDFQHALEATRKKINSWVESQTNGKIKDLLASGSIDVSVVLVLVNAIYFKGKWKREFKKTDTKEKPFWISQVAKDLTYAKLQQWTCSSNMKKQEIKVFLPKFKLEEKYILKEILAGLGMVDVFSPGKANLTGMANGPLVVSKVIHQAYVEVNEEGTEAAGATGVTVVPVSANILPEFKADHPFMFFIRHNKTQSVLFFGKVVSPE
ncbi:serpin B3-like isoform X2 [Eublepharis macularius]|uniref:Serpin B3-like isoform X2 n=1 Tax=Eublepharis macularius TaxID=481883 RepID=A0AA97JPP1_EUBMA|nr:serpin B3-like isoform X2 [Eublepharis macularius]